MWGTSISARPLSHTDRVDFEMVRVVNMSATELLLSARRALSILSFCSSNLRGMQPCLPRA